MELIIESDQLTDYLKEFPPTIRFTPAIKEQLTKIKARTSRLEKQAEIAFDMVRDDIQHSFDDPDCQRVTISADEVLHYHQGICFAKAHLLATLLRGLGIPTGFCYQLKRNPKAGYVLHGLNAVHFKESGWHRIDPRGNRPGIDSHFSLTKEKLAYPIDPSRGEIDYPNVFIEPLLKVINAMQESKTVGALFYNRPHRL